MGKYYVTEDTTVIDEVTIVDADHEEVSVCNNGKDYLEVKSNDSFCYTFRKSDIDKMIALFQAAKDKLCN